MGNSRRALVFAALACLAAPAWAAPPAVTITDWGIVDRAPIVGQERSDTLIGRNNVVDPRAEIRIAERTTEIDACLGTRFGILFRAEGVAAPRMIDVTVHHPEQVAPNGRRKSTSRWKTALSSRALYTGWGFEAPYELVAGEWTFVLSHQGHELARQSFTVRTPNCALSS